MRKRVMFGLGAVGLLGAGSLLGGCSVFGIRSGYEEAAHTVLVEDGDFEIRRYDDALVARTVTSGEYDDAGRSGFRRLGGFIFGKNVSRESVAMTTPVFQVPDEDAPSESIAMTAPVFQEQDDTEWTMTFVMPSEYTAETLPVPVDPNVEIVEQPGGTYATVRYSGFLSAASMAEQTERLRAWMEERGLTAVAAPRSAGYDPPWTLPWFRRNEVQIEIAPQTGTR